MRAGLLLALALLVGGWALAQSFGGGFEGEAQFGPPPEPREYGAPQAGAGRSFFIHRQELKLGLILGFMVGAGVLAFLGRPWMRKAYLVLAVAVLGFGMGGFLCPTSAVQNVFLKAGTGYLLLFLVPVVGALLMGRLFCGYVCPFGALQELLHVRRWAVKLPDRAWKVLNWVRYVVLVYLVARVLATSTLAFEGFSPFKPLFTWGGTAGTIAFTAVFAILSIVLFRPFCRSLCPYGALLSVLSPFSLFRVRAGEGCRSCGLCTRVCPAGAMKGGEVDATECLLCGACAGRCGPGALGLAPAWAKTACKKNRTES